MISQLRGTLIGLQPPSVILDVQGVGYEVEAPMSTIYNLPAVGEPLSLLTHLVVREDAQLLYGFKTEAERHAFDCSSRSRALVRALGWPYSPASPSINSRRPSACKTLPA